MYPNPPRNPAATQYTGRFGRCPKLRRPFPSLKRMKRSAAQRRDREIHNPSVRHPPAQEKSQGTSRRIATLAGASRGQRCQFGMAPWEGAIDRFGRARNSSAAKARWPMRTAPPIPPSRNGPECEKVASFPAIVPRPRKTGVLEPLVVWYSAAVGGRTAVDYWVNRRLNAMKAGFVAGDFFS